MAKEKMMNEVRFSKMVGEFDSLGELIKTRQDEKQSVMDEFDKERARFRSGKISKKTVESSARKTNKEMSRLNGEIRRIISKSNKMANSMKKFVSGQSPRVFSSGVSGIASGAPKKVTRKKAVKKRPVKKRVVKKKTVKRKVVKKKLIKKEVVKKKAVKKRAPKISKKKK